MRTDLIAYLSCPSCNSDVELAERVDSSQIILEGALVCVSCERHFPIVGGIPRMMPEVSDVESTSAHFEREFTALEEDDRDIEEEELLEFLYYSRTGLDQSVYRLPLDDLYPTILEPGVYSPDHSAIKGKIVLDAGCGPGRFLPLVAQQAERLVGLDLGQHVQRAARRVSGRDNVDLMQGSVLAPPFKRGVFDVVVSIGVLHHTPDPAGGVEALARLVSREGTLSVWVYPNSYWPSGIRGVIAHFVHAVVSRMSPKRSFSFCARFLFPLGRVQAFLAKRRWTKLAGAPLFLLNVPRHPQREVMIATIHDYYGPPIISTHSEEEVAGWFHKQGLKRVEILPVPVSVQGFRPLSHEGD